MASCAPFPCSGPLFSLFKAQPLLLKIQMVGKLKKESDADTYNTVIPLRKKIILAVYLLTLK